MQIRTRFFSVALSIFLLPLLANATGTASDQVTVIQPYARAVPEGQLNSAAFMVLRNSGKRDVALVEARSEISHTVELHTHRMEGGMMRMRRVKRIDIKAGSETVLQPGGLHIMFIGLKQALSSGDMITLELVFDDGSSQQLEVPVKVVAGMQPHKGKHMPQH